MNASPLPPPSRSLSSAMASRSAALRDELLSTVDLLFNRRADLVSEGFIADYVALRWFEWNAGALRLTASGDLMCAQMRARLN